MNNVVEHVYRGSPLSDSVSCGSICGQLWSAERASTDPDPHRELRTLRIKVGVMKGLQELGEVELQSLPRTLGWKIGTGSSAKVLEFQIAGSSELAAAEYIRWSCDADLDAPPVGDDCAQVFGGYQGQAGLPEDGFVWRYVKQGDSYFWYHDPPWPGWPSPPGLTPERLLGNTDQNGQYKIGWTPADSLVAGGSVEDYNGQSYDLASQAPSDPGLTTVAQRVRDELSTNNYPTLNAWYDSQLGDTADYGALLDAYAPLLLYDAQEDYRADSPATMTDNPGNELVRVNGSELTSPNFDIDFLGSSYGDGVTAVGGDEGDHIDANGSYDDGGLTYYDDWTTLRESSVDYRNKTYGRAAYDSNGHLWLQYWFFYYLNPQDGGVHEGDWEMIQVRLDSSLWPDRATYAKHSAAETRDWGDVQITEEGRPIVFVADESHASYFNEGSNNRLPCPTDYFDGANADQVIPDVIRITDADPAWVTWPGEWGGSDNSPDGPAQKGIKWRDPGAWADTVGSNTCHL